MSNEILDKSEVGKKKIHRNKKGELKFYEDKNGIGNFNLTYAFDDELNLGKLKKQVNNYLVDTFFEIVSLILERATYGKHKLDSYTENNKSPEDADILFTRYSTNVYGRIWNEGQLEFSINHIYSPGLMLHELGHYLYHLGDEYKGCQNKGQRASIMQYSFGYNTRFKRKFIDNDQDKGVEEREYKVLPKGGFAEFWNDQSNKQTKLKYEFGEVVTDFCNDLDGVMKHNTDFTGSEQNTFHGISCWSVMIDDDGAKWGSEHANKFKYGLKLTKPDINNYNQIKMNENLNFFHDKFNKN